MGACTMEYVSIVDCIMVPIICMYFIFNEISVIFPFSKFDECLIDNN